VNESVGHRLAPFRVTEKPWGRETLVELNDRYAFKEIVMIPGTRSSLQSHRFKLETIYVVDGEIELETIDAEGGSHKEIYRTGEAYTIPIGTIHRVTVLKDSRLFEVSTPHLDDVIRHADDYGRE
jgi:mannose-6-phosphate isomerase-like protein (cupin superfamily)